MIRAVYYVESPMGLDPVAICPIVHESLIEWSTTSRSRCVHYDKINTLDYDAGKKIPHLIKIEQGNIKIDLLYLTLKIFNEKLKGVVNRGEQLQFSSDKDVQDYYLNTNFQ